MAQQSERVEVTLPSFTLDGGAIIHAVETDLPHNHDHALLMRLRVPEMHWLFNRFHNDCGEDEGDADDADKDPEAEERLVLPKCKDVYYSYQREGFMARRPASSPTQKFMYQFFSAKKADPMAIATAASDTHLPPPHPLHSSLTPFPCRHYPIH